MTDSQQVAWWPVHRFIESVVAQANYGHLPIAGTPAWCELADGDPRKLLSLAVSGEHWTLRTEVAQERLAEASREIAEAGGWTELAHRIRSRSSSSYIPRRAS